MNELYLKIHVFIKAYRKQYGVSPCIREIAEAFPAKDGSPKSTSVIRYYLDRMEEAGMIERARGANQVGRAGRISRNILPLPLPKKYRTAAE